MASPKHQHRPACRKAGKKQHRPLVLRRAMLHSCLCFLVGLVIGLAPSDWADVASRAAADANAQVLRTAAQLASSLQQQKNPPRVTPPPPETEQGQQLVVVVTTTAASERERRAAGLTRTAHALRLVSPPVLWLVVEAAGEAPPTATLLRRTGVPYRHLTYSDNFTSQEEERHQQRNVALAHVERHRLRGVLLFAGLADVYDLRLLENLRNNMRTTVGAWAVATVLWERVAVEGPICTPGAAAAAWFTAAAAAASSAAGFVVRPTPPLEEHSSVHGFAFATDLLWDPARWDRFPTSEPDQSQDSIKFLQRLVVDDYNKTTSPIIPGCSHIMAWRLDATLVTTTALA